MKKISKTARKRAEQKLNAQIHKEIVYEEHVKEKQEAINNEDRDKDILEKFNEQMNKREAIVELVDLRNIKMKANLSEEQRNTIVILLSTYNKLQTYGIRMKVLYDICNEFIEMSPSVDGKRAEQYVEAHKSSLQNNMLNPMNQQGQYGNYSDKMQQMRR